MDLALSLNCDKNDKRQQSCYNEDDKHFYISKLTLAINTLHQNYFIYYLIIYK